MLGIWWFIFQRKRPGHRIPEGSSYVNIGFKTDMACTKRDFVAAADFRIFCCLLPSGRWSQHNWSVINSRWPEYPIQGIRKSIELTYHYHNPGTLVSIIQNNSVSFSFLQITYLGITQAVCSIVSTFGFWYVQKYFKIRTKNMFLCTNFFSAFIPL